MRQPVGARKMPDVTGIRLQPVHALAGSGVDSSLKVGVMQRMLLLAIPRAVLYIFR